MNASDILAANDRQDDPAIEEGDNLVIPVAGSGSAGLHPLQYTPHRGDTLVTVADRFNVTTEDLRQWNHLRSAVLPVGRKMYVAEPVRLAPAGRGRRSGKAAARGKAAGRGSKGSSPKKSTAKSKAAGKTKRRR